MLLLLVTLNTVSSVLPSYSYGETNVRENVELEQFGEFNEQCYRQKDATFFLVKATAGTTTQ